MSKVGLLGKFSRDGVRGIIEEHARRLRGRHDVTALDFDGQLPCEARFDLAIVFGGDGTILQAARYLAPRGIGAVGVNLGKFGFLAGCVPDDCRSMIDAALAGKLAAIDRTMLEAEAVRADGSREELCALNDIVITASVPTRMIGVQLSISDQPVSSFLGDGLIVSTATGSTGYNLSSGGPIVTPQEDVLIVNPLAPHTLAIRPMVISSAESVEVEVSSRHGEVAVTADGQVSRVIADGDRVRIGRAPHVFKLFEAPGWSFYKVLTEKLRWGEDINYAKDPY
jgi:NAD+ kinase